jgi:hypothetical protein
MAETKYGKYIVTELKQDIPATPWHPKVQPAGKRTGGRLLYLDGEVVPEAFYMDSVWIYPPKEEDGKPGKTKEIGPHAHEYDEILAFFGSDLDDPHALNAEVELWLGDEKHIITKSCIVFIPKGLKHCPLRITKVTKPIFHISTFPGTVYFKGAGD